ncbi:MAG: response regulator [Deltaproteobacteria bacterium]|nr:response regulator [Deltaproteobacteria bacterium]
MASILLLEDDRHFSEPLAAQFRLAGHDVTTTATGREATEHLRHCTIDLVVVDGLLPDTNGLDWIAGIRSSGCQVAVVFVSSFWRDFKSYQLLTNDLGVMLVVHKPVQIPVLVEQIEMLLPKKPIPPVKCIAGLHDPEINELHREFQGSLVHVVKELEHVVTRLLNIGYSETDVAHARIKVHNIRGTAALYGFLEVGTAAAELEDVLVELMAAPESGVLAETAKLRLARFSSSCAAISPEEGKESHEDCLGVEAATMLVISTDRNVVRAVEACCLEAGVRSLVAATLADALAIEKGQGKLQGLFIDFELPGPEDRREAMNLTRVFPDVPVAFIGMAGRFQDRIDSVHFGAARFLEKPLDLETVRGTFREFRDARLNTGIPVMIVDDDERFSVLASNILTRNGFSTYTLTSTAHIMEAMSEVRPGLLILDILMPGVSGFDICKLLRQSTAWRNLPIIVTTALTGLDVRLAAFRAGADDYVSKPFVEAELLARIKVRLDRARLERELAAKDSLTGLLLRRPFAENAQVILADARRRDRPVSLCLIDIDRFKQVNDQRGHLADDRVISGFGHLVQLRFRKEDLRGRWGGEEFVLMLPGQNAATAGQIIDRLLNEFCELAFPDDHGGNFRCSFSAGVASFGADGESLDDLLKVADRRLYRAKESGRRQVIFADTATPMMWLPDAEDPAKAASVEV